MLCLTKWFFSKGEKEFELSSHRCFSLLNATPTEIFSLDVSFASCRWPLEYHSS